MWDSDTETVDRPLGQSCLDGRFRSESRHRGRQADDWPRMLAACPDCGDAVHPYSKSQLLGS
ncbi:hypothetical protein C8039_13940 [Halogeometricum sp. wsp3]|nr:hypothetical protein C8039_13940 [Halogeometricum sp. wsp3]